MQRKKTMIRKCYLTDEYVFYAEERAKRPQDFSKQKMNIRSTPRELCPFCPENEYMTPKRVFATDDEQIRIVPNKYPFFSPSADYFAVHDVLIDTKHHEEKITMFSDEHISRLIDVIKCRQIELEKDERLKYVQVFKNQGIEAGASQSHSHWQITGLPILPLRYEKTASKIMEYKNEHGGCYFCDMLSDSRNAQSIIEESKYFIVLCPYDSRFCCEMQIIAKRHIQSLTLLNAEEAEDFAIALKRSLLRLTKLYSQHISYNICFYSSACGDCFNENMHFYAQIIPRIGQMAGFEFSTGCFINSMLPENAAKALRNQ